MSALERWRAKHQQLLDEIARERSRRLRPEPIQTKPVATPRRMAKFTHSAQPKSAQRAPLADWAFPTRYATVKWNLIFWCAECGKAFLDRDEQRMWSLGFPAISARQWDRWYGWVATNIRRDSHRGIKRCRRCAHHVAIALSKRRRAKERCSICLKVQERWRMRFKWIGYGYFCNAKRCVSIARTWREHGGGVIKKTVLDTLVSRTFGYASLFEAKKHRSTVYLLGALLYEQEKAGRAERDAASGSAGKQNERRVAGRAV